MTLKSVIRESIGCGILRLSTISAWLRMSTLYHRSPLAASYIIYGNALMCNVMSMKAAMELGSSILEDFALPCHPLRVRACGKILDESL